MLTIQEMISAPSGINETALAELSDRLWRMGSLPEIQKKTSPELFCLHIGVNLTGNWKADGWWYILCEQANLVPYIPAALDSLRLPELKTAFENVLQSFPEFTVFQSDNSTYYDIVNFLQNTRFPVQDERLKCIEPQKRKEMVAQLHENLNLLEALTEPVWGERAECSGWKPVMDYIQHIFNQEDKTWV